jgi:predicted MPP superfamily phosphohydrolase
MVSKLLFVSFFLILFFLIDLYAFQGVKTALQGFHENTRKWISIGYWGITAFTMLGFISLHAINPDLLSRKLRMFLMVGIFMNYFSKTFMVVVLVVDDLIRGGSWLWQQFAAKPEIAMETTPAENGISRSEFLAKTGIVLAAVPFVGMAWGILGGAHDYRVRRIKVKLPNLPDGFHGLKIAQLSDIHSGSFFNKRAVKGGINMLLAEKPDVVFFTGDLVNNTASEVAEYVPIFSKVAAPMGVYSVLGNHDYGDYVLWPSQEAKRKNLEDLKEAHRLMGWKLLMNEHHILSTGQDQIAILGIENWGAKGRFPKYGSLANAYRGAEEIPVKLLLSHDPSHWDAQVRPEFPDIDIMFAGHTHGMQFGVEIGSFQWSPVQYVYDQWAGLYTQGSQHLYVNRGFGFIGYPGRIGMPPEITIMELVKA